MTPYKFQVTWQGEVVDVALGEYVEDPRPFMLQIPEEGGDPEPADPTVTVNYWFKVQKIQGGTEDSSGNHWRVRTFHFNKAHLVAAIADIAAQMVTPDTVGKKYANDCLLKKQLLVNLAAAQ